MPDTSAHPGLPTDSSLADGDEKGMPMQPAFGSSTSAAVARVLWTALLMGAIGMAVYLYPPLRSLNTVSAWAPVLAALPSVAATAFGGAVAVRILGSRWPEPALAALLFMVASLLVVLCVHPRWDAFQLDWFVVAMPLYAGGVFLLPLFDPAVRRDGPAPSRWKVALGALAVTIVLFITGLALSGGGENQLAFAIWVGGGGLGGSTILLGLALLMTAVRLVSWGAWCGAFGWALFASLYVVYGLIGWLLP